ncbi:unnamed protein product, partial [Pocillopora meandrina]
VCVLKVGSLQCSTNYTSTARLECRMNHCGIFTHNLQGTQQLGTVVSTRYAYTLHSIASITHLLFTLSHNKKTHRKILLCGSSKTKECFAM